MTAVRQPIAAAPPQASTRMGTGSALLEGIDGRTTGARRYKEVVAELFAEITHLKRMPSGVEQLLARRAALIVIWCEKVEANMANGEEIDMNAYTAATNNLRRLMAEVGLLKTE